MSYKVIESFPDAQDKCHIYNVGDAYPRDGLKPAKGRIAELLGSGNARNRPLIAEVADAGTDSGKAASKKKKG